MWSIMKTFINDRGMNITTLQSSLLRRMDGEDATRVVMRAKELIENLPATESIGQKKQGLMLGLVQSGKTVALTTAIALAADNGYRCFIVLTTDNLWLYNQTIERLKSDLQGLEILGKDQWEGLLFAQGNIRPTGNGLVLVSTKNVTVLSNLVNTLSTLKSALDGRLPVSLIIDDEADQASLDTRASQRAKKPFIDPGRINNLITQIRQKFDSHTYLQVTATPQALFLQDVNNLYRPEFTILIEPGKGYIGGNTFFSLEWGRASELIRYVSDEELEEILESRNSQAPESLKKSICTFYVGATIKYLQDKDKPGITQSDIVYSFLCHISYKKKDHDRAAEVIKTYKKYLEEGVNVSANSTLRSSVEQELLDAYNDLSQTVLIPPPPFEEIWKQLQGFMPGTDIQILNSNNEEQNQPRYSRRYNILIGGNKLARGVTIENLLVTYYGRQAKRTNMDTMLQHARMYGYREQHLDVTRLFVTPEVEERFRLINESEQALRDVVERYPNEEYRGILIGKNLNATRRNVLNPNNVGAYAAGTSYFPARPLYQRSQIKETTKQIDQIIDPIYSYSRKKTLQITIDQMIEIVKLTKSDPSGSGLWNDDMIITALETLKKDQRYNNIAFLVARRNRELSRPEENNWNLRSVLGPGDLDLAKKENPGYPTLFMYQQEGKSIKGWDEIPFWIPVVAFPDGQYALMFNLEQN
jgi:Z1 domain